MPPRPSWYRGREAIRAFLAARPLSRPREFRLVPVGANGQPAFAVYVDGRALGIEVVTLDADARVAAVTAFHQPAGFAGFDLPEALR
jgi:RNA polymerase sigma-70 factor (ECF subfamily)